MTGRQRLEDAYEGGSFRWWDGSFRRLLQAPDWRAKLWVRFDGLFFGRWLAVGDIALDGA